jgi:apolipoprotein N-acyltransferase
MLAKFTQFYNTQRWALLSGLLIGTSYIPLPPWAALFGFLPLWWHWRELRDRGSLKDYVVSGWLTGFTLTLLGFNWVAHTIKEFGHMPWPVALLGLLLFAGFANLFPGVVGALIYGLERRKVLTDQGRPWVLALLTALVFHFTPTVFPWNFGYGLYWIKWPGFHLAELIGFQGLSTLVLLGNGFFFKLLVRWKARSLALFATVVLALTLAGWGLKKTLPEPDQTLNIAIVQANIGNLEKQYAERGLGFRDHITTRYLTLSETALTENVAVDERAGPLDFIVWPETAFPSTISNFGFSDEHFERLKRLAQERQTSFIFGGYGHDPQTEKPKNALFHLDASGRLHQRHYFKTHLLAFGEYIPGVDWMPWLRDVIPASEFARGPGPTVISIRTARGGSLRWGPQICYESLFPYFTVGLANLGAQIIVNVTNDSWYGTWQEPYQHLTMTLARAIEVRRPLVRSTNTGISTVVLASGDQLDRSPLNQEWSGRFTVPYVENPSPTVYQRWPWLLDFTAAIALTLLLISGFRHGRSHRA